MFFQDIAKFIEQNPDLIQEFPNNISIYFDLTDNGSLTGTDESNFLLGLNDRDSLSGLGNNDLIIGGAENDTLAGGEGDDLLIGNSGHDVAQYSQAQTDFSFKGDRDRLEVIGALGRDTLVGIESLEFSDGEVAIDDLNLLPATLYDDIEVIETTIPNTGDAIDIYIPEYIDNKLPIAILLPGANVDKSNYSIYAETVSSYGFAVVVPNNIRTIDLPDPAPDITGNLAELSQINEVFDYLRTPESPIDDAIDPDTLALLGHSFGGAAGLYALQGGSNIPNDPFGEFERPEELAGGIFFGTDLRPSLGNGQPSPPVPLIDNNDLPTGLVLGDNDGISDPAETRETYDQIEDPPKALIAVEGTNHFGITNDNNPLNPPTTPEAVPAIVPDPNPQEIPQAIAIDTIATWSALFLRATVLEDASAYDFVFGTGDELDSNVSVINELPADF